MTLYVAANNAWLYIECWCTTVYWFAAFNLMHDWIASYGMEHWALAVDAVDCVLCILELRMVAVFVLAVSWFTVLPFYRNICIDACRHDMVYHTKSWCTMASCTCWVSQAHKA